MKANTYTRVAAGVTAAYLREISRPLAPGIEPERRPTGQTDARLVERRGRHGGRTRSYPRSPAAVRVR
jgi:hypothetical protein